MGFAGFNKAKERLDQAKAERAEKMAKGSAGYFRITSGEDKLIRFLCDFENEPYIFKQHFVKRLNRSYTCTEDADCIFCEEREAGDKGISNSFRAAVSIFDYTVLHKIAKKGQKDKFDFEVCTGDRCKLCRQGVEAKVVGKRYWEMSQTTLDTLLAVNKKIGDRCKGCGSGKISVTEFECPKCGDVLDVEDTVRTKCTSCHATVEPREILSCNKCDRPERATLNDCDWSVQKSGEGTTTTFVLTPEPFSELDSNYFEKPEDSEPLDLAAILKPLTRKEAAKVLGVDFGNYSSGGAHDYDHDEAPPRFEHSRRSGNPPPRGRSSRPPERGDRRSSVFSDHDARGDGYEEYGQMPFGDD